MERLLMGKGDAARIGHQFDASKVGLLTCDAEGTLELAGRRLTEEEARPTLAWASSELLGSAGIRAFMVALLKSPDIRWLQSASAGIDDPVFARLRAKGVAISTSDAQAPAIADFVIWSVLDRFQRGDERRAAREARKWLPVRTREIGSTCWLILGFGAIGQAVAQRACAAGARIVAIRRSQEPHPLADEVAELANLHARLGQADVVVAALPSTAETAGLAGSAFFGAMKRGSMFVNVGRGDLVDETALLAALAAGRIDGAALDVFRDEPLSAGSTLWDESRVQISAHCAGLGDGRQARDDALFLRNIAEYLA